MQNIQHFSRRYYNRGLGEMFLVACHQIGILFRHRHFVEHNVFRVREKFLTMNTPCIQSCFQDLVENRLYCVRWKMEFLPTKNIFIFSNNFWIIKRTYSCLGDKAYHFNRCGIRMTRQQCRYKHIRVKNCIYESTPKTPCFENSPKQRFRFDGKIYQYRAKYQPERWYLRKNH